MIAFNLACEFLFVGFWHWLGTSPRRDARGLKPVKFNPVDQYDKTSNLQREVTFTTLGWLQTPAGSASDVAVGVKAFTHLLHVLLVVASVLGPPPQGRHLLA